MKNAISNYSIKETLHQGKYTIVYRAFDNINNKKVILKTLQNDYPEIAEIAQIKREYDIISSLNSSGVYKAIGLIDDKNKPVIILEDFGGQSFSSYLKDHQLNLKDFLQKAITITEILTEIHAANIIHKDINPSNILINRQTNEIKISDFGISTKLSTERAALHNPNVMEGTLPYMSPEQTGRVNRSIDYRSDLYSLGISFYEALTGNHPFQTNDPMEIVHYHIAGKMSPPTLVNRAIPKVLSNIILKLCSKTADERYQSASGLKHDLEKCYNYLETTETIPLFEIGKKDINHRFQIPQNLYGRTQEIKALMNAFASTERGKSNLFLINGSAGIGKTALVKEIHKPIVSKNGYFISGKFDQFKTDMPFYAFTEAFKGLVRYLAGEASEKVKNIKQELGNTLGLNAALLLEQVPELKTILEEQDTLVSLNPTEAQNRFFYALIKFIEVFAKEEHPLTIFIDDLQWSDDSSLHLIKELILKEIPYLLIIGAYRDNEVNEGHPLTLAIDDIKNKKAIYEANLNPLPETAVNQMLADTFNDNLENVKELTSILYKNTAGNPFYINELLKKIYHNGLISFDINTQKWQWDITKIKTLKISKNVVEFMIQQLKELPQESQNLLQLAATIGEHFELRTLAIITNKSASFIANQLYSAIEKEIIYPLNNLYRIVHDDEDFGVVYQFVHDKIQQSAYFLGNEKQRAKRHFKIGTILKKHYHTEDQKADLIELVRHLNNGRSFLTTEKEILELANLNLEAAKKAETSIAYKVARNYYQTGLDLLPKNYWQNNYTLAFSLAFGLARSCYLTHDFEYAEKCRLELIKEAQNKYDKARIISMSAKHYVTYEPDLGLRKGLEALALLGYEIPENPDDAQIGATLQELYQMYLARTPESILNGPVISEPEKKLAANLLIECGLGAYVLGNANLYTLTSLEVFRLTLEKGLCPESSSGCITIGAMLGNLFGDMKSANVLGLLGLDIIEKLNSVAYRCRAIATYGVVTGHHNMHWSKFHDFFKKGIQAGYAAGDRFMLAWCAKYCAGWEPEMHLEEMITQQRKYLKIVTNTAYQDAIDTTMFNLQVNKKLSGISPNLESLSDEEFDEVECLTNMATRNFYSGIGFYHVRKAELYLANDNYEKSWETIQQADPLAPAMFSLIYLTYLCHISYFTCAGYLNYGKNPPKDVLKERMSKELEKMKTWAAHNPENYLHWQLLMEAEWAALENKFKEAASLYEQAIQTAKTNKWLYNEAFACELAAKFYYRNNILTSSTAYFKEAIYLYKRRGAMAKIDVLEANFPNVISKARESLIETTPSFRTTTLNSTTYSSTKTGSFQNLDVLALVKAYQAISGEIEFKALLEKMMRITMMTAGAEKGMLLIVQNDKFIIQAKAIEEKIETLTNLSLTNLDSLPTSIINYVARLKEPIVLDNASKEGEFTTDPYIKKFKNKSILCIPIVLLNELYGIIYLENNLSIGAFTNDRIQVLELLSSQMAISINNSRVYENLEQVVEERTQQLQELNHTKDRIFAILGHDLRKPAIAFRGIAKKVNYLLKRKDYDTVTLIGENIEKNAFALNKLVDNLLNWALTQKNALPHNPEYVSIKPAIEEVNILFSQIAIDKKIDLELDIQNDLKVWVDRNGFLTVLRNLVDNALKYTDKDGNVTISAQKENGNIHIMVSDSGTGIPKEKLNSLFELKKNKSKMGTAGEKGTGLGLHLVHELVKLNGGKISVDSQLNEGTTFTLALAATS